jgi:hypothetical protein
MHKGFCLLALLAVISRPVVRGQIVDPQYVTFIGAESAAAQLKWNVCAILLATMKANRAGMNDWEQVGSGFFINQFIGTPESLKQGSRPLAITCNHVAASGRKKGKDVFVGIETTRGFDVAFGTLLYADTTNDIAVLDMKVGPGITNINNVTAWTNTFGDESKIVEGRGVLLVGYPLGAGIENGTNRPIVRFGMVAQKTPGSKFLIDAMASHENSGSPVYALTPNGPYLLGMALGFRGETINLFDETGRLAASLPYNSGLAEVVKTSYIIDAVKAASFLRPGGSGTH